MRFQSISAVNLQRTNVVLGLMFTVCPKCHVACQSEAGRVRTGQLCLGRNVGSEDQSGYQFCWCGLACVLCCRQTRHRCAATPLVLLTSPLPTQHQQLRWGLPGTKHSPPHSKQDITPRYWGFRSDASEALLAGGTVLPRTPRSSISPPGAVTQSCVGVAPVRSSDTTSHEEPTGGRGGAQHPRPPPRLPPQPRLQGRQDRIKLLH